MSLYDLKVQRLIPEGGHGSVPICSFLLFFFAEYLDVYIGDEGEEEPLRSSNVKILLR
jgi:hypothetical protein